MTRDACNLKSSEIEGIAIGMTWAPDPAHLEDDLAGKLEEFLASDRADRIKDVYACYGLAMYYAQCLEVGLRNLLVGYARAFGALDVVNVDTYADNFARDTLGRLLARLRQSVSFDHNAEDLLRRALLERNRLAHRFFEERVEEMCGPQGHEKMVRELLSAAQLFRFADFVFAPFIRVILNTIGVDESYLKQQYEHLQEQAQTTYGTFD